MSYLYSEIKNDLINYIGKLNSGDKIPSRHALCLKYNVTRTTIDRAINELIKEKYLYTVKGSGTFVSPESRLINPQETVCNWGVIVPDILINTYPGIIRGIDNVAQKYKINVIVANSDFDEDKQTLCIKRLVYSGVKGVIIVPAISNEKKDGGFKLLLEKNIPFVFCNRGVEGISAPIVTSNDFYGGYIATKHLIEKGYKKITYIAMRKYTVSIYRYYGFVAAMQENGLEVDEEMIVMKDYDSVMEGASFELKQLFKKNKIPDGIFCYNDVTALGVYNAIKEAGYRVSDDIGVVGYDNTSDCCSVTPQLTSVSYANLMIGEKAAEILYSMINGKEINGPGITILQPELYIRESCLGKKAKDKYSLAGS